MTTHNIDRLYDAVAARGPVCVGLDTAVELIPEDARRGRSPAEAALAYNRALIDATADVAACYKVQIACYEEMGVPGLAAYARTLACLRERGCLVIADVKRGDIADTAARYARAHFSGDFEADFVTLSPYMGMDSIDPWLEWADTRGKGAFVLLRTSNPGARDFQGLETTAGGQVRDAVGARLAALAAARRGAHGYGVFGAVVGATGGDAAAFRDRYPSLFFLIPGYGAQGASAADAARLLRYGNGGVVNASRSILRAWQIEGSTDAAGAARRAVIVMRDAIQGAA